MMSPPMSAFEQRKRKKAAHVDREFFKTIWMYTFFSPIQTLSRSWVGGDLKKKQKQKQNNKKRYKCPFVCA